MRVLDATCGGRQMWFDKNHPDTTYMDTRRVPPGAIPRQPNFSVEPDVVADFRDIPFPGDHFDLVVFDPPHADISPTSIIGIKYGTLFGDSWQEIIVPGFVECMRVLRPGGVLVFKWAESKVKVGEVIAALPLRPLFGHTTGKSGTTKWMTFVKPHPESDALRGEGE